MKLTAENYFSPEAEQFYMGSTQFKRFMQCEACAMAYIRGEYEQPKSVALLVGSYVDAHFSNELDLFKAQTPEIFTRAGDLKSEYKKANEIIERIERDELFMQMLTGKTQEIMTGEINGVPFKIKVDSLLPYMTVDLKIMRDCSDVWKDGELLPFWKAWEYDIQAAIYREIRAQNDGEIKPFRLAVATKETETDLQIFEFSDETLEEAYKVVYNLAPRFQAIKNGEIEAVRCGVCNYCRMTKTLKVEDIKYI
ncbi:MAG: PD-(D/E)XK nuclease-like domain-containing protein [Candidatus Riflebacteria bacterium]|nr:PD-(D/E)XK nuclease-like domain-containing protein [Candidatus Riflebacteria bacterium]